MEPKIVIVGGGPAGLSTALYLATLAPALKDRLVILEKAFYPRDKICAGGLIQRGLAHLDALGISLSVPHVGIDFARIVLPDGGRSLIKSPMQGAVVSRRDFDAQLAAELKGRGVEVREGVGVLKVKRTVDGIGVITDKGALRPEVVVGADGTGSIVRRSLFPGRRDVARTVVRNIPVSENREEFQASMWRFDFTQVERGLQGYSWLFPVLVDGKQCLNVGLYDRNHKRSRRYPLGRGLAEVLKQEKLGGGLPLRSFPIREYRAGEKLAQPHALLVGDAAGADPLMGEGISIAFDYGKTAAREIAAGFSNGNLSFQRYGHHVWRDFGWRLWLLGLLSSVLYGRQRKLWFSFARKKAIQERAARWYLGLS